MRRNLVILGVIVVVIAAILIWLISSDSGISGTAGDGGEQVAEAPTATAIDSDGDGIADPDDVCPAQGDVGLGVDASGCPIPPPDGDGDGIADADDACPGQGDQGYGVDASGCPKLAPTPPPPTDSGIRSEPTATPEPDEDGDGVPDAYDDCPGEGDQGAGVDKYGCPEATSTSEPPPTDSGIRSEPTATPEPDEDGDGVADAYDDCPGEGDQGAGVDKYGCPEEDSAMRDDDVTPEAATEESGTQVALVIETPTPDDANIQAATLTAQAQIGFYLSATPTQGGLVLATSAPTASPEFGQGGPGLPPSPTPVSVAMAGMDVVIRDISGQIIGDGTLRIFAPEQIAPDQSARVELEIALDRRYITPTPDGFSAPQAPPPVTSTPGPDEPTATPRHLMVEEQNRTLFANMGASLLCPPDSFSGCDDTQAADRYTAQHMREIDFVQGASWTWRLRPVEGANGWQDLEIELWTLKTVDGEEIPGIENSYPFKIEIMGGGSGSESGISAGGVLLGVGIVIAAAVAGAITWLLVRRARPKGPKVFISYRRVDSEHAAGRIYTLLERMIGADRVFMDVSGISPGENFIDKIGGTIDACEVLIAIIGRQWLTVTDAEGNRRLDDPNDFVRLEIATALQQGKKVVPVLIDGATMPAEQDLPENLRPLFTRHAVQVTHTNLERELDWLIHELRRGEVG